MEAPCPYIAHHKPQDIICDFLNGYAFGNVLGVGIQSLKGWWTVDSVEMNIAATASNTNQGVDVELQATPIIIAPLQTRVVPFFLNQSAPFTGDTLGLVIHLKSGSLSENISVFLPVVHHQLTSSERKALKGTFLSAATSLSAFLAIPPALSNPQQQPPILALRQLFQKPVFPHLT